MHLRHLSRLLALLLGIFYPGGACELDAKECKQNYGKDSHDYVLAAAADAHDAALHLAPMPRPCCPLPPGGRCGRRLWVGGTSKARPGPCPPGRCPGPGPGATCATPCCKSKNEANASPGGPCPGSPGVVFVRF